MYICFTWDMHHSACLSSVIIISERTQTWSILTPPDFSTSGAKPSTGKTLTAGKDLLQVSVVIGYFAISRHTELCLFSSKLLWLTVISYCIYSVILWHHSQVWTRSCENFSEQFLLIFRSSPLSLAGGKHYRKLLSLSLDLFFKFCSSRLLSLYCCLLVYIVLTSSWLSSYCSIWLYFSPGN